MNMNTLRLFFRIDKVGKVPYIGSTGFAYVTPIIERYLLLQSASKGSNILQTKPHNARLPRSIGHRRYFSSVTLKDITKSDEARGAPKKKPKTIESTKIKLVSESEGMSVVTLEEAEKIAARKGLHITLVSPKKENTADKATYRLITKAELLSFGKSTAENEFSNENDSEKDEKKKVKDPKTLMLKSKIAEHDVLSKIGNVKRWLEKGHSVRVVIGQPNDKGDSESLYKMIESKLKDNGTRFLQKVVKGDQIRVQLMPPPKESPQSKTSKTELKFPKLEIK